MTILDDLLNERYGRDTHAWWKTPRHTLDEDMAVRQRQIWLDYQQEIDELEKARERAGRGAA